jgi:hypothetical protein
VLLAAVVAITLGSPSGGVGVISAKKLVTRGETATLTFELWTSTTEPREVLLPFQLAPATRLTGLSVSLGATTLVTTADAKEVARSRYDERRLYQGVALVEHVAAGANGDELRLRIAGVSRAEKTRVVLTAVLNAESGDWMTEDTVPRGYVAPALSMVAQLPPSSIPAITIAQPVIATDCFFDSRSIRKTVKRQHARLRACYERGLMRDHDLAGTVVLHFDIPPSGRVEKTGVSGTLPSDEVRACIAEDLAQWQFPAFSKDSATVRISYPLHFRRGE